MIKGATFGLSIRLMRPTTTEIVWLVVFMLVCYQVNLESCRLWAKYNTITFWARHTNRGSQEQSIFTSPILRSFDFTYTATKFGILTHHGEGKVCVGQMSIRGVIFATMRYINWHLHLYLPWWRDSTGSWCEDRSAAVEGMRSTTIYSAPLDYKSSCRCVRVSMQVFM